MFYRIISYCIHKCIHIFFIVQILHKDFQRLVKHWFNSNSDRSVSIENNSQVRLKKLPSHLGIIINEDHIAINDIASIINWCLGHGIYHVSIYDEHGYVKGNNNYLYEECLYQKDTYLKERSQDFNIIFYDGITPYSFNKTIKNGHIITDLQVYLLGHENGKQYIVNAAKNVCKDAIENPSILQNFHAKHFGNYLTDAINIPDPELIIKFGRLNGLLGYLPWHIRLTEIISYPTHHNLEFEKFQEFLFRYCRCEQRFGT